MAILKNQKPELPVVMCLPTGEPFGFSSPDDPWLEKAVRDFELYAIGNRNRIRYIAPFDAFRLVNRWLNPEWPAALQRTRIPSVAWRGGSRTIRRLPILNDQGEKITGLRITEHKGISKWTERRTRQ